MGRLNGITASFTGFSPAESQLSPKEKPAVQCAFVSPDTALIKTSLSAGGLCDKPEHQANPERVL